jgi:hypothetical protein
MMDKMMQQMAASMGSKMGPEGMVKMMDQMVGTMFADMTVEDKIAFMQAMMGACMSNILGDLSSEERQQVATTLFQTMQTEMQKRAGLQTEE